MGLNTEKTKICIFGRRADKHPFLWKGVALEGVNAYKYIGIWITKNGHFRKAEQHLSNQVKKALFSLKAAIQNLQFPPVSVSLKNFDAMIIPIICYGCEILGFSERSDLEVVEMNFIMYVLHLPVNASNIAVERANIEILASSVFRRHRSPTKASNGSSLSIRRNSQQLLNM